MKKRIIFLLTLVVALTIPITCKAKVSEKQTRNVANVVLFAYFSDDNTAEEYFKTNRNYIIDVYEGTAQRSVVNVLKNISYGKLAIKNVFPQDDGTKINAIKLPFTEEEAKNTNIDYSIMKEILKNAPEVKNKIVDYDGDGIIDNVTIMLKGTAKSRNIDGVLPTLWAHRSSYAGDEIWSGKKIVDYNILNTYAVYDSIIADKAGVIVHEFLHTLGFPDLYPNQEGTYCPVSKWDIMAVCSSYPQYPLAYLRHKIGGWIDINTITKSTTHLTLDLQSNENGNQAYILKSPLNENELFVVEFRKKPDIKSQDVLDSYIPGSGMVIYRINNSSTGLSNFFGNTGVYVFRAPGYGDDLNGINNGSYFSKETGRTSFGNTDINVTKGALTYSDGSNSGILISNISSSSGNQMTFDVTIPQAKDYDLWEDKEYTDNTSKSYSKLSNLTFYNNKLYVVSSGDNKILTKYLENNKWVDVNTLSINDSNFLVDMSLFTMNNNMYLLTSDFTNIKLYKFINNKWNSVASLNISGTNSSYKVINNELYISAIDGGKAKLYKLNSNIFKELGTYYTAEEGYLGQTSIEYINNTIYVFERYIDGAIYIYKYDGMTFTLVNNSLKANQYATVSYNNKIYISLGKDYTNEYTRVATFDGSKMNIVNTQETYAFPKLVVSQGNVYMVASDQNSKKVTVFAYDEQKNKFIKEGNDVDTGSEMSSTNLIAVGNKIYVTFFKTEEQKIYVKEKETTNSLVSINIIAPKKTTYLVGEKLDKTGMKVIANYVNSQKEVTNYTISGFSTEKAGTYIAKVNFEGITNTFSYEVHNKPVEKKNIKYTAKDVNIYYDGKEHGIDIQVSDPKEYTIKYANEKGEYVLNKLTYKKPGTYTVKFMIQAQNYNTIYGSKKIIINNDDTTSLVSINIIAPKKTTYLVGEKLDKTGMKVIANYVNSQKEVTNYTISGFSTEKAGTYIAKVNFEGITNTFSYEVHNKPVEKKNIKYTAKDVNIYYDGKEHGIDIQVSDPKEYTIKYANEKGEYVLNKLTYKKPGTYTVKFMIQAQNYNTIYGSKKIIINNDDTTIKYQTHVQYVGWQGWKNNGEMSGTEGQSLRLEGIYIKLNNKHISGGINYQTHVQYVGWQEWKNNGEMSGTEGQSLRLEAIKIKLTGDIANYYDIYYRVHSQNFGWLGWAKNGESAGTEGYSYRLEGIEIRLIKKGTSVPENTTNSFIKKPTQVNYQTHVQYVGWQEWKNNGEMSGTEGQSLRLEAININLSNLEHTGGIKYQTHVQYVGWQGWKNNGEMSGTEGQSLRLEAIKIELTGDIANYYDIYYRVHSQNFGWLGWAKNGESAGTEGYSYRLEGIQIKLIKKNANINRQGQAFYKK